MDYTRKDYVKFTMYDFIEDVLKEVAENMDGMAVIPTSKNLFEIDNKSDPLGPYKANYFHQMIGKLLFASNRARLDIQVAVVFLCTRVKGPNKSNYKKLTRLMRYLRVTVHWPLLISWVKSGRLTWSIDTSFSVHKYMRGCTSS